jgi:hypothetical protein
LHQQAMLGEGMLGEAMVGGVAMLGEAMVGGVASLKLDEPGRRNSSKRKFRVQLLLLHSCLWF